MATKETLEQIERVHQRYKEAIDKVSVSEQAAIEFLTALKSSKDQTVSQVSRTETKKYDLVWIENIDNAINALENICKDPKKHIRLERYITPIELAKKITNESVIHLSSHTQYIKNVDKNGNVIPSKVLTVSAEDEYGIYENRFIKTLVDRLVIFIEKRYDYITKHADTRDSDVLHMTSKVEVGEVTYEYDTKVKLSVPSADEGNKEANERLLKKIELLRKRVQYVAHSWFMDQLKDCKPVSSPIMRTNIIVKNPNYKKAHILWKFIEKYDKLGISIFVKETDATFDDAYVDELQKVMFASVLSLQTNKTSQIDLSSVRAYKVRPKVGNKIIDKDFLDSKFDLKGVPYYADRPLTAKQKALKKRQEEARKAKEKVLEMKRLEREKERNIAKQKEEERLAKLRALKEAEAERKRIAKEKAEAKAAEEARIAKEKAEEKAMLDAERQALIRARQETKRLAEEARIAELKILRPNGLTPEEEAEKKRREEEEAHQRAIEAERQRKMEDLRRREEARKKALEEKMAYRKASLAEREKMRREQAVADEQARKEKARAEILALAQAKLKALHDAELAIKTQTAAMLKKTESDDK